MRIFQHHVLAVAPRAAQAVAPLARAAEVLRWEPPFFFTEVSETNNLFIFNSDGTTA